MIYLFYLKITYSSIFIAAPIVLDFDKLERSKTKPVDAKQPAGKRVPAPAH